MRTASVPEGLLARGSCSGPWPRCDRRITRERHDQADAGAVGQHGPLAVGGLLERRADRLHRLRRRARPARPRRRGTARAGRACGSSAAASAGRRPTSSASAADGVSHDGLVGLAGDVPRLLADRQRRGEELGVVAPRLDRRGDPVRERAQQVRAQRQPAAGEQLGQRQLAGQQRLPLLLPVVAGDVRDDVGAVGRARPAARRPPRTSPGRRRRPARGPSARRSRTPPPTAPAAGRPRRSRCRRPARRRRRRGRRSSRRRTACPWCGAAGRPRGRARRRAAAARSPPAAARRPSRAVRR